MFVSLETTPPPPHPLRNVTHSDRYFVQYSTHKVIFYYFLRSAIGDASARNMSSSADISFFINICELQNFQRFSMFLSVFNARKA